MLLSNFEHYINFKWLLYLQGHQTLRRTCNELAGLVEVLPDPFPRNGGVEELHGDPTVGPCPKKNGRSSAKDDVPEMRDNPGGELHPAGMSAGVARILLPFYPA